ncbi:hypothetical protein SEA_SEPHIROTH_2 [Gordonia Phage Sephiroth]|uniref:Uncharacterized protein n=1 Tax=Gordonia Phage Sephiroth TaxID=2767553 RepID=A0A7G9UZ91_9CAUD|nr:hypothetical protein L3Y23_gp002 [Gordonia Phage Sephiroth]QNN99346.1 hypothetical protein SEA_SEPHIROTH_2 [Gordonia Phage Sephiroth]
MSSFDPPTFVQGYSHADEHGDQFALHRSTNNKPIFMLEATQGDGADFVQVYVPLDQIPAIIRELESYMEQARG